MISQPDIESLREEDLPDCVELQRLVWQFDKNDLVSTRMLATCQRHEGILLGARMPEGGLVGFVFSFPAFWKDQLHQHSHMLAVRKELRDQGIGFALKLAQYREARRRGLRLITWTFDPLETKNAHLNLNKLGVIVRHYYVNLYGEQTSSELHSGLGTDRFLAEWSIGIDDPAADLRYQLEPGEALSCPQVISTRVFDQRWLVPDAPDLSKAEPRLLVEVPEDIQSLKRHDPKVAMDWRLQTRTAFTYYLSKGYEVSRLLVSPASGKDNRRTFYQLEVSEKGGSVA